MDIKIIYLTNDTRRYAGMKNACLQLQDEMIISDLCMAVKLERSSEWNYVWERKLRGAEDEMVRWHHQLSGHDFEQTLGDSEGQGSLACCSSWGRKKSDTT